MKDNIKILDTPYAIIFTTDDKDPYLKTKDGYINSRTKQIVICDISADKGWEYESEYSKEQHHKLVLRHEIIHAFLIESGLDNQSNATGNWAINEEMVDWMALQFPRIYKVFEQLDILE